MRTIAWFTNDLRLHDNESWNKAASEGNEVIPLYCFDDSHFENTSFGFKKTGTLRLKFLLESITALNKQLNLLGSQLIIVKGKPEIEIVNIVQKYKIDKVFAMEQTGVEEKRTQQKVELALSTNNCVFESSEIKTLFKASDLPFSIQQSPIGFTEFRKHVEAKSLVRPIYKSPEEIKTLKVDEAFELPDFSDSYTIDFNTDSRSVLPFKGGETEALNRLHYYLWESHAIDTYKATRNEMIGERYSTKFSPWLSMGCLSPRFIYHEIKKYEKQFTPNESTYWVIFELLWREFFIWMMIKYPYQYFTASGIHKTKITTANNNPLLLQRWIDGKTDSDFINANMIELKLTGFMSNRGRQNAASYWCHDLKLDWRYGAAYFEQQLIDYDVSSNWCNWAYIAGVGNNPRGKSIFNIEKQAKEYDNNQSYRKLWLNNQ